MIARRMGVAAESVTNQNGIILGLVEPPIGLISDVNRPQCFGALQLQGVNFIDYAYRSGFYKTNGIFIGLCHSYV